MSSIVLYILLQYCITRKYVEYLLGKPFVDQHFVKGLHGFYAPIMFFAALSAPMVLEDYTLNQRLDHYSQIINPLIRAYLNESEIAGVPLGDKSSPQMNEIYELMNSYRKPCNGIVTQLVREIGL